jgi:uncharacterized phage protein (TIGR01671 family)
MREILFRGKRIYEDEWVEGSLICFADGCFFVCVQGENMDFMDKFGVIPETVGQYTGLLDKDGKKVFEGDIISFGLRFCAVKYDMENARYMFYENGRNKLDGFNCETMKLKEVIGNVFDNPELLEVT